MKSLELISYEWINTICWNYLLFGIFMIKKWVEFSLTSFGTLKYGCVIKTGEMFNFLPLINNSVTIEFSFLIINHISNHIIKNYQYFSLFISIVLNIIKNYQYFSLFISIVLINIFINILHIIGILNESFWIIKVL